MTSYSPCTAILSPTVLRDDRGRNRVEEIAGSGIDFIGGRGNNQNAKLLRYPRVCNNFDFTHRGLVEGLGCLDLSLPHGGSHRQEESLLYVHGDSHDSVRGEHARGQHLGDCWR